MPAGKMASDESEGLGKLVFNRLFADVHRGGDFLHGKSFKPALGKDFPAAYRQPGNQVVQLVLQQIEINVIRHYQVQVLPCL